MIQSRWKSVIFILGLIVVAVQLVCALLVVQGIISVELSAAIVAIGAGILAYCNGNNPSDSEHY